MNEFQQQILQKIEQIALKLQNYKSNNLELTKQNEELHAKIEYLERKEQELSSQLVPIMHRVIGLSLVNTNILKVFIIFTYTLLAVFVFAATSEVLWLVGAIAGIGNIAGGIVGAKLTLSHGEALIRKVLTLAIIGMIIKLLFFP